MELVILLVWGLIWGGICAWLAGEKGRGEGSWFVLGFFFSLIALIALGFSPSTESAPHAAAPARPISPSPAFARERTVPVPAMKKCPDCAEEVRPDARLCRYCRHEFWAEGAAPPSAAPETGRHSVEPGDGYVSFGVWRVIASRLPLVPEGGAFELRRRRGELIFVGEDHSYSSRIGALEVKVVGTTLQMTRFGVPLVSLAPADGADLAGAAERLTATSPSPGGA